MGLVIKQKQQKQKQTETKTETNRKKKKAMPFFIYSRDFRKMFTVMYKCRVYELGTNKEVTDAELALDISLSALVGDRDQPLHPALAPEHCAIVRATKRGYLLVRANVWTGAHVLSPTGAQTIRAAAATGSVAKEASGCEFVFRIPVQPIGPSTMQPQESSVIIGVLSALTPALSRQFQYPDQSQNVDGDKYRVVLQGAVKVAYT